MSIWTEIRDFLSRVTTDAFSSVVENVRTIFEGDIATRRRVAFSVALIALSAKMAKADGVVTDSEVAAFKEVFHVPPSEMKHVARLYNLAKQDVVGFDYYGAQVRSLFPGDDPRDRDVLKDVIDALFHIAKADGLIHENELLFLEEVTACFGFDAEEFDRIKLRHMSKDGIDPYLILGGEPDWDIARLKALYRKRAAESHPDRLIARGVPHEFIKIATDRLATLNAAWENIQAIHVQREPTTVS